MIKNDISFTGVPCRVKACRAASLIDVNKYISSTSLSTGCEYGLAGRGKRKIVIEMDRKFQLSIYSSKLKGLLVELLSSFLAGLNYLTIINIF